MFANQIMGSSRRVPPGLPHILLFTEDRNLAASLGGRLCSSRHSAFAFSSSCSVVFDFFPGDTHPLYIQIAFLIALFKDLTAPLSFINGVRKTLVFSPLIYLRLQGI